MKQKEKLFSKQDILAWRVGTEDQIEAERVKRDPSKAYKFILPEVRATASFLNIYVFKDY